MPTLPLDNGERAARQALGIPVDDDPATSDTQRLLRDVLTAVSHGAEVSKKTLLNAVFDDAAAVGEPDTDGPSLLAVDGDVDHRKRALLPFGGDARLHQEHLNQIAELAERRIQKAVDAAKKIDHPRVDMRGNPIPEHSEAVRVFRERMERSRVEMERSLGAARSNPRSIPLDPAYNGTALNNLPPPVVVPPPQAPVKRPKGVRQREITF